MCSQPPSIDLDTLRVRSSSAASAGKLPRPRRGESFVGGPIPIGWVSLAVRLPGKTWHVASALWFAGIRSRTKSAIVHLTAKTMTHFGLCRRTVYRALAHLEAARLVRVERQRGKRLLVTLLPVPEDR
jgi:hypothetical protein